MPPRMIHALITQSTPGAQTERRGDAGPVRDLLGGKAAPGEFVLFWCRAALLVLGTWSSWGGRLYRQDGLRAFDTLARTLVHRPDHSSDGATDFAAFQKQP